MLSLTLREPAHEPYFVGEERVEYRPARPTVYLDTTIPSFLAARSQRNPLLVRQQRITRIWWLRYRARYELRVSSYVRNEAAAGDAKYSSLRLSLLEGIEILEEEDRSQMLRASLLDNGLLPATAALDATHIAIAATHSIRYLLTWNCKHLANPFISRKVVRMCELQGFHCPVICTPEDLMRGYAHA